MAVKREKNKFDMFNEWVMNVESSIITLIATIIPWMTPVAPSVMTFKHATDTLQFHPIVAFIVAATVEALGFASLYLMISFIMFNKKNRAKYKVAPTWAVAVAFIFYLGIIVVSNVLLDAFSGTVYLPWVVIAVKALFTLMAIPGGIVVVVRAAHNDLLRQAELDRLESESGTVKTSTSSSTQKSGSGTGTAKPKVKVERKSGKTTIYAFIQAWMQQHGVVPSFSDVQAGTQLPNATVSRWLNTWIAENP